MTWTVPETGYDLGTGKIEFSYKTGSHAQAMIYYKRAISIGWECQIIQGQVSNDRGNRFWYSWVKVKRPGDSEWQDSNPNTGLLMGRRYNNFVALINLKPGNNTGYWELSQAVALAFKEEVLINIDFNLLVQRTTNPLPLYAVIIDNQVWFTTGASVSFPGVLYQDVIEFPNRIIEATQWEWRAEELQNLNVSENIRKGFITKKKNNPWDGFCFAYFYKNDKYNAAFISGNIIYPICVDGIWLKE